MEGIRSTADIGSVVKVRENSVAVHRCREREAGGRRGEVGPLLWLRGMGGL